MKLFVNDTAVLNYPLADEQDIGGMQSMLMDLSLIGTPDIYMTNMWSTGTQIGGLFMDNTGLAYHFEGSPSDGSVAVVTDRNEPVGWIVPGPGAVVAHNYTGSWKVNPVCLVAPTTMRAFTVNGVSRAYPNVLRIVPQDYITEVQEGTKLVRAPFANTQDLDSRDWDHNGPILSINGKRTETGDCTVDFHVTAQYTDDGKILLSDTGNFGCDSAYTIRDNAIMNHEAYGLQMELPLDNMVRVWKGECPRRPLS